MVKSSRMGTRATIKQSPYTFIMHTHSSYTKAKQSQIKTFSTDQWSLFIVYVRFHYKSCNLFTFSRFVVWFYFGIKNNNLFCWDTLLLNFPENCTENWFNKYSRHTNGFERTVFFNFHEILHYHSHENLSQY